MLYDPSIHAIAPRKTRSLTQTWHSSEKDHAPATPYFLPVSTMLFIAEIDLLVAARARFAQGVAPSLAEVAQAAGISRATLYRAFSSREELLRALAFEPEVESREQLLAKALEMIGQQGLAALSMDALADAAGVSRATVYRLFPGKAALFREVVKTYAPFERLALLVEQVADRPPEEVMPQVAQVVVELFATRAGLYRTLAFEISSQREDTQEAAAFVLERGIGSLLDYLQHNSSISGYAPCNRSVPIHRIERKSRAAAIRLNGSSGK
jgi:AcrR family transcriptional regulator